MNTSLFESLFEEVKQLILGTPIDIYSEEHDVSFSNSRYELVSPREIELEEGSFTSSKIGLANLTWARQHIYNVCIENMESLNIKDVKAVKKSSEIIWESIAEELEKKRIIRIFPALKREEGISLIVNNER